MAISTVVCYKTKKPVYYNKGTKWEKTCSDFLAYYTFKSVADAEIEVAEINATRPEKLWNGEPINWEEIDHFYVSQQEEM